VVEALPSGLRVTLACVAASAWVGATDADGRCQVRAEITPDPGVVGEQLLHSVQIERSDSVLRVEWIDPPRFPDFRAEWLPGGAERAGPPGGEGRVWIREERRSLFPLRAGELRVSSARIACHIAGSANAAPRVHETRLPALIVRVDAVPTLERPDDWAGLVGPVRLTASAPPAHIELGDTLHFSTTLHGEGNVWDAAPLLDRGALESAPMRVEVFPADSTVMFERGTRLQARRSDRFDIVPRTLGTFEIRTRAVSWYDPERRVFARATPSVVRVEVVPATQATDDAGQANASGVGPESPPRAPPAESRDTASAGQTQTLWIALLAAGLLAVPIAGLFVLRACQDRRSAPGDPAVDHDAHSWAAARDREIRAALARLDPEIAGLTPRDLLARAGGDPRLMHAAETLAGLERLRFDQTGPAPDAEAIQDLLRQLAR
jgi:hypothetical protein